MSKAPEEEREKIQPDCMKTNDSKGTIGTPPVMVTHGSIHICSSTFNEIIKVLEIFVLKRKLQEQFKGATQYS